MEGVRDEFIKSVSAQCYKLFGDKAALAKLRRGIGKKMGERPELLAYVLLDNEAKSEKLTATEQAVYTALTLYALHQQGQSRIMHDNRLDAKNNRYVSFGAAVKKLVNENNAKALQRRFVQVATASSLEELAVHARSLINMLNKNGIALNYGQFAYDLYRFQNEDKRREVLLSWGRDFYLNIGKDE